MGKRINLTFVHFDIEDQSVCGYDAVELDMVTFTSKHCGRIDQPWGIVSSTNTMNIRFISDYIETENGFLATWTSTDEPPTYLHTSTGCDDCIFPFVYDGRTFDTCTSIDGDQPWCLSDQPTAPVDEGTHVIAIKSYCSDTDSSCPSTPQMSIQPNNQPGNCCKFC